MWALLSVDEKGWSVALPESWLKGGEASRFNATTFATLEEAKKGADFVLAPGSHAECLDNLDHLHGCVNDVYSMFDEGYIDGQKVLLAFRKEKT